LTGVAIGLAPSVRFVGPSGVATIAAVVTSGGLTWSISPAGFGALSNQASTGATYTAPATVSAPTVVTITATSTTSTGVSAPIQIAVQPSPTIALEVGGNLIGPQTINAGQQISITAVLAGDTNNQGVTWSLSSAIGTLANIGPTSVTYIAPGSVSANTPVTLTATAVANTGSTSTLGLTVFPSGAAGNVAALTTDNGLTAPNTNTFFTSVTVCVPGTTTCQTIDNIEVDTGSEGLRILQSAMTSVVLPQLGDGNGNYANNCVSFLDGSYLWGPVAAADIYIGGEKAAPTVSGTPVGVPIQLISSANPTVPTDCSNGGTTNDNTAALLGANGLLGIGLEPTDCILQGTDFCDGISTSAIVPAYFSCPSSGCLTTDGPITASAALGQEVTNPVVFFATNSNGTAITFPALSGVSAPVANGSLIFGIGTSTNNAIPGTATVFPLDAQDFFSTVFNGQTLTSSFIDTGSNGLFFPSSITACGSTAPGFYCPATQQSLSATNGGIATPVNFKIDNADTLFAGNDSAFQTLGGPLTGSFDWGAPFFYGRTVFTQIDGQATPAAGVSPFWAY
jgi:hypothetical protein